MLTNVWPNQGEINEQITTKTYKFFLKMPTEGLEPGFLASRLVLDTREPEFESMYRHIFFFICDWCVSYSGPNLTF